MGENSESELTEKVTQPVACVGGVSCDHGRRGGGTHGDLSKSPRGVYQGRVKTAV